METIKINVNVFDKRGNESTKEMTIKVHDRSIMIEWDKEEFVSINPSDNVSDIAVMTNQSVLFDGIDNNETVSLYRVEKLLKLEKAIRDKVRAEAIIEKYKKDMGC